MKIGYILAGMIFLFNPHINIIDVLPDVIGYILILHGLSKLSDLERNLLSARDKFLKLAWLSAVKLSCLLILPIFDETLYLIFTFCFGLLEVIWLIPAFVDMFHGISFLESRYTKHRTRHESGDNRRFGGILDKTDFADGRVFFEVYGKTHENGDYPADEEIVRMEGGSVTVCAAYEGFVARDEKKTPYFYESVEARVISVLFVILRTVCACLPELTALLGTGDSYVHSDYTNDYSGLRYILEAAFAVVAGIIGIIWLVRMIRYFRVFMNDAPFLSVLSEKYDAEILPNKALWVKRKTLSFCLFSAVALAFMACIRLSLGNITNGDGMLLFTLDAAYLIPEFLFGALMIPAFRCVRDYYPAWREGVKRSIAFSSVSFAAYVVCLVTSLLYGRTYRPYKETQYIVLFVIYMLLFVISMVLFVYACREKEKVYKTLVEKIGVLLAPDDNDYAIKKREHLEKEFKGKIQGLTTVSMVYAGFSILCMALIPWAEEYAICGLSWLFRSAFCIFFILKSILLTDKIQHEIEKLI